MSGAARVPPTPPKVAPEPSPSVEWVHRIRASGSDAPHIDTPEHAIWERGYLNGWKDAESSYGPFIPGVNPAAAQAVLTELRGGAPEPSEAALREAAWKILDRIYVLGLPANEFQRADLAKELNALESALGGRAARYAAEPQKEDR